MMTLSKDHVSELLRNNDCLWIWGRAADLKEYNHYFALRFPPSLPVSVDLSTKLPSVLWNGEKSPYMDSELVNGGIADIPSHYTEIRLADWDHTTNSFIIHTNILHRFNLDSTQFDRLCYELNGISSVLRVFRYQTNFVFNGQ